jgi:hypothetical protein
VASPVARRTAIRCDRTGASKGADTRLRTLPRCAVPRIAGTPWLGGPPQPRRGPAVSPASRQRRTGREVDAEPREPRRATLVPRMEAVHPSGLVENSNGWSHTGLLGGAEVRCSSAPVGDSHRAGRRYGDLSTATMEPAAVKPCRRPSNHGAIQDHYLVVADALVRIASDHSVRMVTSAWKSVVSKGAFRLYARFLVS